MGYRTYMLEYREKRHICLIDMAARCGCSTKLLSALEFCEREVTHPNIAKAIAREYELTQEQYETLVPLHYRKSSAFYDPNLYKRWTEAEFSKFVLPNDFRIKGRGDDAGKDD